MTCATMMAQCDERAMFSSSVQLTHGRADGKGKRAVGHGLGRFRKRRVCVSSLPAAPKLLDLAVAPPCLDYAGRRDTARGSSALPVLRTAAVVGADGGGAEANAGAGARRMHAPSSSHSSQRKGCWEHTPSARISAHSPSDTSFSRHTHTTPYTPHAVPTYLTPPTASTCHNSTSHSCHPVLNHWRCPRLTRRPIHNAVSPSSRHNRGCLDACLSLSPLPLE